MSRDRFQRTDWYDDEAELDRPLGSPIAPGKVTLTMGLSRPGIHRSPAAPGKSSLTAGLRPASAALVSRAAHSPGQPLPDELRGRLEDSLGTDLGRVRVHTCSDSAEAAHAVGAKAYALGSDIHFGAGRYDPASQEGQRLVAHEVAHTVQQRGVSESAQTKLELSAASDAHEIEADQFAAAFSTGLYGADPREERRWPIEPLGAVVLQREGASDAAPSNGGNATSPSEEIPSGTVEVVYGPLDVDEGASAQQEAQRANESPGAQLGLSEPEFQFAMAAMKTYLGKTARASQDQAIEARDAGRARPNEVIAVEIQIDASMLNGPLIRRALMIRILEGAFQHYGIAGKTRGDHRRFYDSVAAHSGRSWFVSVAGEMNPPDTRVRAYLRKKLDAGETSLRVKAHNIAEVIDWYSAHQERTAREIRDFIRRAGESNYAALAILDFYIAHVNAPINLLNGALDVVTKPLDWAGGPQVPHIPKIPMQGEIGRKYQASMEMGAMAGLGLAAAAAGIFAKAGAAIDAQVGSWTIGGINIGPGILKLGKAYLIGVGASELHASAQGVADDLMIVKFGTVTEGSETRDATDEEKQAAWDRLQDRLVGVAVAGAGIVAGKSAIQGGKPRTRPAPEARVVREGRHGHGSDAEPRTREATSRDPRAQHATTGHAPVGAGTAARIDPGKFDYLFGKAQGAENLAHNAPRTNQNALQMKRLGVADNAEGRALLQEHFDKAVRDPTNVSSEFENQFGRFEVRESLFAGPSGKFAQFRSTWEVMDDGSRRLTTVIPIGGS